MKLKILLSIFAAVFVACGAFSFLTKPAGAQKSILGTRSKEDIERIKQLSLEHLRTSLPGRLSGNIDELKAQAVVFDDLNMAHTRVRQTVGGVPVWEGEAIVHLKSDGSLAALTDDLKDSLIVTPQPNLSAEDSIEIARKLYRGAKHLTESPKADLWIYRGKERDHLVYRVRMRREDGSKNTALPVIFVDAQTGEKVFEYDNLQTASGLSLYSGTVNIGTSGSGSAYYMEDLSRRVGTFTYNNTTTTISRYTDPDNLWNSANQLAGVDAQYGATLTMNYFQNIHGRNGIDGNGGPGAFAAATNGGVGLIGSVVHYSTNYNNAYWNGSFMTYGDGDGVNFSPLTTIDICGHEMTHGVTQHTAGLVYSGEPGALNEAMSDIFGAMIERYARGETGNTWKIGEEAYTPGNGTGDALRYFTDPNAGGQPDWYPDRYTGAGDNGGVHINSGIANYAFYLMSKGGTTPRGYTVVGINADDMAKIWYRALTTYMTSGTDFAGARAATLNAAADLFNISSQEYDSVSNGWCAVGVGTCVGGGTPTPTPTATPTPTPTPTATPTPTPVPVPTNTESVANGSFESSVSPWVKSGTGAFYTANGAVPHSGTGYMYFGVNNNATGAIYEQIFIPNNSASQFTFWLNVVSSESTTTRQFDKLYVEAVNTSGVVQGTLAVYSNLDKAAPGVYTQKTLDLLNYKNKTIRIQFRAVTDGSTSTTFNVDDVSVR
jgi:thermolysin